MNRHYKRSVQRYAGLITRIARKLTIKKLEEKEIDYVVRKDTILSQRQTEVKEIYDNSMLEATSAMIQSNFNIGLIKKLYNLK